MTLKTIHGGPVFDGLWNMQCSNGDNYYQVILNGGANNGDREYAPAFELDEQNWEPDPSVWTLTHCYMPINLVKWSE